MSDDTPQRLIKVESLPEWQSALREIESSGICGLHLLTSGPDQLLHAIRLISLALPTGAIYIADCLELGGALVSDLAALIENAKVKKVIHDAKDVISFLRVAEKRKLNVAGIFDLMLASQICWSGYYYLVPSDSPKNPWKKEMPQHSLAALADRHLGIILEPDEKSCGKDSALPTRLIRRVASESAALLPLYAIFAELIVRNDLQRVADLEFRVVPAISEMEVTGIRIDVSKAQEMVREKESEICDLVWQMQDEAAKKGFVTVTSDGKRLSCYINPDRQEDVMAYLNKRGYAVSCTRAEVLRSLAAAGCGFAEALLRYRQASRTLAFLNSWLEHVHPADGRVHPRYFQIPSTTGRISSRDPNGQQIPRAGDDAPAVRELFVPDEGMRFVKADYSTIELRIMACLSGDSAMQQAFREGADLHRLTASRICGVPLEEVTAQQRQAAKVVNFLLIYGGSARGLQWRALSDCGIFMPLDEAEKAREKFFQTYQGVREWQEQQVSMMSCTVQHHFHTCTQDFFSLPLTATVTALGRRRLWPRFGTGIRASKFQLFNTPCQGTGADLIKLVMAGVYERLSCQWARMVDSIHDEIILEAAQEGAEEYSRTLQGIMEQAGSNLLDPVPVRAEAGVLASLAG